jgi:hypothetical protein
MYMYKKSYHIKIEDGKKKMKEGKKLTSVIVCKIFIILIKYSSCLFNYGFEREKKNVLSRRIFNLKLTN